MLSPGLTVGSNTDPEIESWLQDATPGIQTQSEKQIEMYPVLQGFTLQQVQVPAQHSNNEIVYELFSK